MILTPDQLRELTGHKRSDAQRRELEHMGVPFRVRRDGTLVVLAASLGTIAPNLGTAFATLAEPELQP